MAIQQGFNAFHAESELVHISDLDYGEFSTKLLLVCFISYIFLERVMVTSLREQRKIDAKALRFKFLMEGFSGQHTLIQLNKSPKGLGGMFVGSQFPGRGTRIKREDKEYIIRWVRVSFGFLYRFGLEAA